MNAVPEYAWRAQAAGGAIINAVLNGGFGYLVLAKGGVLPLWGIPSVAGDLIAMTFGIAFGTGMGVTIHVRALARKGRLRRPALATRWTEGFDKWPPSIFRRSVNLGILATILLVPLPLMALWYLSPGGLDRSGLVVFKAVFGFIEGGIVTPVVGLAAFHGATSDAQKAGEFRS